MIYTKEEFKKEFIQHMNNKSDCGIEYATFEFEAIENDIDLDIDCPYSVADECMSYWVY